MQQVRAEIAESNLSCQMCVRNAWHEPPGGMDRSMFEGLLDQLRAFPDRPALHLGGYGEPTFHPDFVEMVQRAKAAGLRVEVTTNGTLLTPQVVSALLEAELDRLVVSIDGAADRKSTRLN